MNLLQLISSILTSVGTIAVNPAFGIAGVVGKILPLIGLVSGIALEGSAALQRAKELDDQLKAIIAAGRPPSDAEWADWDARHQAAHARLQS